MDQSHQGGRRDEADGGGGRHIWWFSELQEHVSIQFWLFLQVC